MRDENWIRTEIGRSLSLAEHFDKHKFSGQLVRDTVTHILPPDVMTLLHQLRADTLKEVLEINECLYCKSTKNVNEFGFCEQCGKDELEAQQ